MEGNIYITGDIGSFGDVVGVQLIDIIQQVKKYPGATSYNVFINSDGGEVETGFDIFNYLRSLGVPIKTIGTGMVASIATVIFLAGDTRVLRQNCQFMIHLPAGGVQGTADEIAQYSKEVEAVEKRMIDFYKKVINTTDEAVRPLLRNETFLSTDQAINLGFATEADEAIAAKAKLFINSNTNNMNISKEDRGWFEKLFSGFEAKITSLGKSQIVALMLTAADGTTMLDFADLAEGDTPVKGDKATIDGKPAEGEILMPDGSTMVFAADKSGTLEDIKPVEADPLEEAQATIDRLNEELATAKLEAKTATDGVAKLQKDFTALKSTITSKFVVEKKEGKDEGAPEKRSLLKSK